MDTIGIRKMCSDSQDQSENPVPVTPKSGAQLEANEA